MVLSNQVELSTQQTQELCQARDHHSKPYIRVKAAAILKVTSGMSMRAVAPHGLLKPVAEETVSRWVQTYLSEGIDGLLVKKGRGRKPAFSPSGTASGAGEEPGRRIAASVSTLLWSGSFDLESGHAAPSGEMDADVDAQWHLPNLTAL